MFNHWKPKNDHQEGFSLLEVVMSLTLFIMVVSGIILGYVQMNRMATWASWSLAAQACASEGLEQARAAQWNELGGMDQWLQYYALTNANGTPYVVSHQCSLDVPSTGQPIYVTNYITVTTWSVTPPIRMIRSDCVWNYPLTGTSATNTVVSLRSPDQ